MATEPADEPIAVPDVRKLDLWFGDTVAIIAPPELSVGPGVFEDFAKAICDSFNGTGLHGLVLPYGTDVTVVRPDTATLRRLVREELELQARNIAHYATPRY